MIFMAVFEGYERERRKKCEGFLVSFEGVELVESLLRFMIKEMYL